MANVIFALFCSFTTPIPQLARSIAHTSELQSKVQYIIEYSRHRRPGLNVAIKAITNCFYL